MNGGLTIVLMAALAAMPPMPSVPVAPVALVRPHTRAALRSPKDVTSGGSRLAVASTGSPALAIRVRFGLPWVARITFQYPPKIDPAAYNWQIETSTNLATWQKYCDATNDYVTLFATDPQRFFRVKGMPK